MTNPKPSVFVRTALNSGLVTRDQIDSAIERLRSAGGLDALPAVGIGDDRLAEMLIEQEILTPYQSQQLRAGRKKLKLGPYLIKDWLGQGGMGQVFVAVHQMMDRTVAIKVLPLSKSTPDSIASFTREIQTQAKLDHRNLVRAYDAGHDGNVYFLVTEYVPGTDLRRLVRNHGRLSMAQSALVISEAAMGLEYAHSRGLIHRDVKPGNVLVTPEGHVKVSDLGLAGFLHEKDEDPRAGKIVGTADYLSPEKIMAPDTVSAVSDIYALGCTLYYAVTGKVPFPGGTTRDKARRHCEETPWHPRQFNTDVTDDFVDLIADMMEKIPERRVQTAGEVVDRLEAWASQNPVLPQWKPASPQWQAPPIPTYGRDDPSEQPAREDKVDDLRDFETPGDEEVTSQSVNSQSAIEDGQSDANDSIDGNRQAIPSHDDADSIAPAFTSNSQMGEGDAIVSDVGETRDAIDINPINDGKTTLNRPSNSSTHRPADSRRLSGPCSIPVGPSTDSRDEVRQAVLIALCWAIPISMLLGGLISYWLLRV